MIIKRTKIKKDVIEINSSGHYYPGAESLEDVKMAIQETAPSTKVNVVKLCE